MLKVLYECIWLMCRAAGKFCRLILSDWHLSNLMLEKIDYRSKIYLVDFAGTKVSENALKLSWNWSPYPGVRKAKESFFKSLVRLELQILGNNPWGPVFNKIRVRMLDWWKSGYFSAISEIPLVNDICVARLLLYHCLSDGLPNGTDNLPDLAHFDLDPYDVNDAKSSSPSSLTIPPAAKKRLADSDVLPASKCSRSVTDLQMLSRSSSDEKVVKVSPHQTGDTDTIPVAVNKRVAHSAGILDSKCSRLVGGNDATSSSSSLLTIPVAANKRFGQSGALPVSKCSRLATDLQTSSRSSSGKKVIKVSLHESGEKVIKVSYASMDERTQFFLSPIFDLTIIFFSSGILITLLGKSVILRSLSLKSVGSNEAFMVSFVDNFLAWFV